MLYLSKLLAMMKHNLFPEFLQKGQKMFLKIQRDQGPSNWSIAQAVSFVIAVAVSLILLSLAVYWGVPVTTTDADGSSYEASRDLASSRISLLLLLGVWAHVLAQYAMSRVNRSRSESQKDAAPSE